MKEKVEEILYRFLTQKQIREDGIVEIDFKETIEELSNLIQAERKEAVEGFVDKIRNEMGGKQFGTNPKDEKKEEAMHISYNWAISDMVRLLETYLQSLDKGDKITSNTLTIMTFGTFFKNKRMETNLSLRQFCKSKGLDPAYISRIENDIIPAPNKQSLLETLAKALDIKENTPEWVEFFDLAYVSKGEMPEDIKEEFPEVLAYLPAFLRSVKKNKVTKEDVNELVDLVKGGYDEPDTE